MKKFLYVIFIALICFFGIACNNDQGSNDPDDENIPGENPNTEDPNKDNPNTEDPNNDGEENPTERTIDIFFSEYGEGSSEERYLELFNATGSNVDLAGYAVALYANGSTTETNSLALSGILKDGQSYIIVSPHASTSLSEKGNVKNAVCNFNGDDVVTLTKNGVIIDIIGVIGEKPTAGFVAGNGTTKDHTLIRNANLNGGNPVFDGSEWTSYEIDYTTNLGKHTIDGYVPTESPDTPVEPEKPTETRTPELFISEYFEGNGSYDNTHYIEIYNQFNEDKDLSGYSLKLYKDGSTVPAKSFDLSGTIKANSTYIVGAPYCSDDVKSKLDALSDVCYFNGKHAIALCKDDVAIDVFGVIGEYPSSGWNIDDNYTTMNNVLIRKESVTTPTINWDVNEWYSCGENYLYSMGSHDNDFIDENTVITDLAKVTRLIAQLDLDSKGTSYSDLLITVKAEVLVSVTEETSIIYVTDGDVVLKVHGEKIHNYTTESSIYEFKCHYASFIYQAELTIDNPSTDIKYAEKGGAKVTSYTTALTDVTSLNREDFSKNVTDGYWGYVLKITGTLTLDTHNSTRYDYCIKGSNVKNDTQYLKDSLYLKNDYENLDRNYNFSDYEGQEVTIYVLLYEWNTNRKNWMGYCIGIE